jgi:hypothetical protein
MWRCSLFGVVISSLLGRRGVPSRHQRLSFQVANDRFLIRKRPFYATASNDGTWPFPAD